MANLPMRDHLIHRGATGLAMLSRAVDRGCGFP